MTANVLERRHLFASALSVPDTGWRWPHFRPVELACRCRTHCRSEYYHDPAFLDALEALRMRLGRPLVISSGRRCALHNAKVGGAPMSQHRLAVAADIVISGWGELARRALLQEAIALGFTGIGFGTTFLHLDRRKLPSGRKGPVFWDYNNGGIIKWMSYLR